jgi:hypothetical protein
MFQAMLQTLEHDLALPRTPILAKLVTAASEALAALPTSYAADIKRCVPLNT